MKIQHIIIAIIVYLLFFRKVARVNSIQINSQDYILLQRDFNEKISVLERKVNEYNFPTNQSGQTILVDGLVPLELLPDVNFEGLQGNGTIEDPYRFTGSGSGGSSNITPAPPTIGIVDDSANTFNWTNSAGYSALSDYEYSVNGGTSYQSVTSKPIIVGNVAFATNKVGVRVKSSAGRYSSSTLFNQTAFTSSGGVVLGDPVTNYQYMSDTELTNVNTISLSDGKSSGVSASNLRLNEGESGWISQKYIAFTETGEEATGVISSGIGIDPHYGGNDTIMGIQCLANGVVLGKHSLGSSFNSAAGKALVNSILRIRFNSSNGYAEISNDGGATYEIIQTTTRPSGVIRFKMSIVGNQKKLSDVRSFNLTAS